MTDIRLPRTVQFMYEQSLAYMEFKRGFNAKSLRTDMTDPWRMTAELNGNLTEVIRRSAYAGTVGSEESVYWQLCKPSYQGGEFNLTRSPNQFLTHWIYPYKGKFHPQIVRAILNMVGARAGWLILDPFVGSGTTCVECRLLGIDSVGVDISPLCHLLTIAKTLACDHIDHIKRVAEQLQGSDAPKSWRHFRCPSGCPLPVKAFFEIARMVTLSDQANRRRDPETRFWVNLRRMVDSVERMCIARDRFALRFGSVEVHCGDARRLKSCGIKEGSIDAVITSPPYSIALDYVKNDEHALQDLGVDVESARDHFIGVAGHGPRDRMARYNADMKLVLEQIARALKHDAPAVLVLGDATLDGSEVTTTEDIVSWADDVGLRIEHSLCKIVYGLYNMIKDEKILFFRRI